MWSDAARQAAADARRRNGVADHATGTHKIGRVPVSQQAIKSLQSGNASVRPTGERPTTGYMVGLSGRTQFVNQKPSAEVIQSFANRNADAMSAPNAHLGIWNGHLDVSLNVKDRDEAIRLGKVHNQISIFDLKKGREIATGGTGDSRH